MAKSVPFEPLASGRMLARGLGAEVPRKDPILTASVPETAAETLSGRRDVSDAVAARARFRADPRAGQQMLKLRGGLPDGIAPVKPRRLDPARLLAEYALREEVEPPRADHPRRVYVESVEASLKSAGVAPDSKGVKVHVFGGLVPVLRDGERIGAEPSREAGAAIRAIGGEGVGFGRGAEMSLSAVPEWTFGLARAPRRAEDIRISSLALPSGAEVLRESQHQDFIDQAVLEARAGIGDLSLAGLEELAVGRSLVAIHLKRIALELEQRKDERETRLVYFSTPSSPAEIARATIAPSLLAAKTGTALYREAEARLGEDVHRALREAHASGAPLPASDALAGLALAIGRGTETLRGRSGWRSRFESAAADYASERGRAEKKGVLALDVDTTEVSVAISGTRLPVGRPERVPSRAIVAPEELDEASLGSALAAGIAARMIAASRAAKRRDPPPSELPGSSSAPKVAVKGGERVVDPRVVDPRLAIAASIE